MRGSPAAFSRFILDIVFPGRCLLCGEWLLFAGDAGMPVCRACRHGLVPIAGRRCRVCSMPLISEESTCTRCRETEYAFDENHSLFAYSGAIKELIGQYKFSHRTRLARLFAEILHAFIQDRYPGAALVPVPSSSHAVRPDHMERIARILEKEYGMTVLRVLERTGGASQKSLNLEQRRTNLRGRIRLKMSPGVSKDVVLLDDVFTTGATADACADALKAAGCRKVAVVTFAIEQ